MQPFAGLSGRREITGYLKESPVLDRNWSKQYLPGSLIGSCQALKEVSSLLVSGFLIGILLFCSLGLFSFGVTFSLV